MGVIYTGNNLFSAVMTLRGFLNNFSLLRKYGRWLGNMIMGEREIFNGYYYKQLLRIFLSPSLDKKNFQNRFLFYKIYYQTYSLITFR